MALRPEPPGGGGPGPGAEDVALPGPVPGQRRPSARGVPLAARAYPPPQRAAPRRRRGLTLAALSLALVGVVVSGVGLVVQVLPRTFSAAQKQQITAWEMGKRWRTWAAGEIFPYQVRYQLPTSALGGTGALALSAHRIGIAHQATCRAATTPEVARILAQHGCEAVLRATYADATQSLALTVGVAVLSSPDAARATLRALPGGSVNGPGPGVRAVPFRRTPVARFGNLQRQLSWDRATGPYLVFATVGYADGRPRVHETANAYATAEMVSLEGGVGGWVADHIGAAPPVPRCPGGPAC